MSFEARKPANAAASRAPVVGACAGSGARLVAAAPANAAAAAASATAATRRSMRPVIGGAGYRSARESARETRPVRILLARCSVEYQGRLGARLGPAPRLVLMKADGSIAVHSDSRAYKPLNWMNPPCTIVEDGGVITATAPRGDTLRIELHEVLHDSALALGDDPGLEKDGVEAELQELIAARLGALREDLHLIRREYPTDIGPVDLLCSDADGRTVVVEVKRVGEITGVDQLLRYQERLDRDSRFAPTVGILVAERIKPQARVYAESRGVACIEVDLQALRGNAGLTLF